MSDDRFQLVMEAFERASTLEPDHRTAFLAQQFPNDPDARDEVLNLLGHHDRISPALATAAGLDAAGAEIDPLPPGESMPVLRGDYRILRAIGEGGMGVVFEAEQAFPRRRVALKALRPGLASARMLRRFKAEAEFLARLHHPGIAQVYEAGIGAEADGGRAYVVMELVEGRPLTVFSRDHRLDIPARWRLLRKVCEAVQHAHQRGVIHRDLKPANILVTPDGNPKIVDFGVARASEADPASSMATREGQLVGTPSYMSPEQILGQEVDTRSDLYSLGVIAYELLTGHLPLDLAEMPITKAARVVAEREPAPLASHDRALRGDAEVVVAKALSKDPARRYASASELAGDIDRLLAGEAILARRDSAIYVLGKQLRRHRTATALVALGLVSLVAFAVYASVAAQQQADLAREANIARREAVSALAAAEAATADALKAKGEADAARAAALEELSQATIERGRMAGIIGNLPQAEDILWREYFERQKAAPENAAALRPAWWALWELYDRLPSLAVRRTAAARVGTIATASATPRAAFLTPVATLVILNPATGEAITPHEAMPDALTAAAIFNDGSRAVVASTKTGVVIVRIDADAPVVALEAPVEPYSPVRAMAVSADGSTIAAAGDDGLVRFWNARTGGRLPSCNAGKGVIALALSPDGQRLAYAVTPFQSVNTSTRVLWSIPDSRVAADLMPLGELPTSALRFDPDGRVLFVGDRFGTLTAFDLESAAVRFQTTCARNSIGSIVLAPDRSRILVTSSERAFVLDAQSGRVTATMPDERFGIGAAGWLDNERFVVATDEGVLRTLDPRVYAALTRVGGYAGWTFALAFSPDGARFAVGSGNSAIDVYDALAPASSSRAPVARHALEPALGVRTRGLRFSPDGQRLYAASADGAVRVIDPDTGSALATFPLRRAEIFGLDLSPDGSTLAVGFSDRHTVLINALTGELVAELPVLEKRIEGLCFSPDGATLAVSGSNRGVDLWDMATKAIRMRLATSNSPWAVAYAPDGKTLFVTTRIGTIDVFDTATSTRRVVIQGHSRLAPALAVSRDGLLFATAGEEGLIKLWDATTLRPLATFQPGSSTVVEVAFSPDGQRLVAAAALREVVDYDLSLHDQRVRDHEAFHRARLGFGK